jgi:hypothetical protein
MLLAPNANEYILEIAEVKVPVIFDVVKKAILRRIVR